jgi:CRP-like cAMP-binding protein/lysophospholipase L1-like esterase
MISATTVGTDGVVHQFAAAVAAGAAADGPGAELADTLQRSVHLTQFDEGDVVVEHHAVADAIHFLVEGSLRYQHLVAGPEQGESISADTIPWMPVGWSSLHFHRHRVTAVAGSGGRLLTIPLAAWQRLASESPALWAVVAEFTFRTATRMLWEARGGTVGTVAALPATAVELPLASGAEPRALQDMYRQSPCFSVLPGDCRRWLAEHSRLYMVDGDTLILDEGEPTGGLWLLQEGRVALTFAVRTDEGEQTVVRHRVRPGALLGWAAIAESLPAPYKVETTRRSTLAFVPSAALIELQEHEPRWVGAVMEQQLWQLRHFLLSVRAQYGHVEDDGGFSAMSDLIEDSKPILPVASPLYAVPYLLQSKLTREQGFEQLYRAFLEGRTETERTLAGLAIELLHNFERGHRFYLGLLATYSAVVRNQHLDGAKLRRISARYFRDALSHIPYVIKGLENLPDDPNCILIYNHMAYDDGSLLPNGFYFNPDSHFLSGVIMEPKYGDGIRIARTNADTEFWRANYYEPQGHISVVTPESGWLEETAAEKQQRKDKFFADCEAVLASGRPFSIAPEGTITEENSVTERSPGPFKAGAFFMNEQLPSRPKIVPVAFANFDKPAYKAVFSCVIKPAFSMEERGVDVTDRTAMGKFLNAYRHEFRGHVEEAIELARSIEAPGADLTGIVTNLHSVDAVHEEFEHEVRALELGSTPMRKAATVFYGSSSFRLWDTLGDDVAIPDPVNLGFGGGTLEAGRLYFERLVVPHEPARLVVYFGENDIANGVPTTTVVGQFCEFADTLELTLPDTRCWFVSIKPSPTRWEYVAEMERANSGIAAEIEQRKQWHFVDWFPHLLDESGEPDAAFFAPDLLNPSRAGYDVLARLLREEFAATG